MCAWQRAKCISWIISSGVNGRGALSQVPGTERVCSSGICALNANFMWELLLSLLSKY